MQQFLKTGQFGCLNETICLTLASYENKQRDRFCKSGFDQRTKKPQRLQGDTAAMVYLAFNRCGAVVLFGEYQRCISVIAFKPIDVQRTVTGSP